MSSAAARQTTAKPSPAFLLAVFRERCEARAILVEVCLYDLHDAIDVLQQAADDYGLIDELGQDAVQKMMAEAFASLPYHTANAASAIKVAAFNNKSRKAAGAAASTLAAAEYLVQQNDPKKFRAWLAKHTRNERLAIKRHFKQRKHETVSRLRGRSQLVW